MQPAVNDPRYLIDFTENPQTGVYEATIPALGQSHQGTFDEVSEWALEQLAQHFGMDTPTPEKAKS